jgi:hypothetical protein
MAQTKVEKLVAALAASAQDIENCLQQLLLNRAVSTATGVQLDLLGRVVGQLRLGLVDDDYRRYIRARIATNRSGGVTEDLVTVMSLVVNDVTAQYNVERNGTATVVARIDGIAVTDSLGAIVFSFLKSAKSGGVRLVVQWSESVPSSTFRLDAGPGLDVGHLASELST